MWWYRVTRSAVRDRCSSFRVLPVFPLFQYVDFLIRVIHVYCGASRNTGITLNVTIPE